MIILINFIKYAVSLLEDFGFYHHGTCEKNRDDVYIKEIKQQKISTTNMTNLEFHKRYTPSMRCNNNANKFLVPIQPEFHNILFPEIEPQKRLIYINPTAGNTIKKAYLSYSNTNLKEGDLILFYKTHDKKAITTLGIVEKAFKTR